MSCMSDVCLSLLYGPSLKKKGIYLTTEEKKQNKTKQNTKQNMENWSIYRNTFHLNESHYVFKHPRIVDCSDISLV